jgi:hypothetical protein
MRPLPLAAVVATAAALALSLPPGRVLIEQSMVWHMLVQMPLLLLAGALGVAAAEQRRWSPRAADRLRRAAHFNRFGLGALMLAQCLMAYWMLPALIDRAVLLPGADAAKLAGLWIAGAALRLGLQQAPAAVQLFFGGSALPMLVWLGLYMAGGQTRLCNAYSLDSQMLAGRGLVALALGVGTAWVAWQLRARLRERAAPAVLGHRPPQRAP